MKKISLLFLFLLPMLFSEGWVYAQSIKLRIPDTTAVNGTILDIPIYADSSLTGRGVYSYTLEISYDNYYFMPESVITSGTISQLFGTPAVNTSIPGVITLAGAGTEPLIGKGWLIILRLRVLKSGRSRLTFTDVAHNFLNEGSPSVILNYGTVSISASSSITVSPDNSIVAKGEKLQMNVSGGKSPYSWSVTDPGLADIDLNGLLTAKESGFTRVIAVDYSGVRDTTGSVEIRPVRLSIPTTLTQWEGATIDVPVMTSDLTSLNVTSGKFQLEFDNTVLFPVGMIQTGTKLENYSVFMSKEEGLLSVAFAGSEALTGAGTLVYVRFKVLSYPYWGTYLTLNNTLMNEAVLTANTKGSFTVRHFTSRYIYPTGKAMVVGESVELIVNGQSIPPYTWSVNDTTVASISASGMLKAKKQGNLIVTVIDSAGASATENRFQVYDTRIMVKDTNICKYRQIIDYQVVMDPLPVGKQISALEGEMLIDTSKLVFIGLETLGTAIQGWTFASNEAGNKVSFAASGSEPLHQSGVLVKLRLLPKNNFTTGSWAGINLNEVSFNEGSPLPLFDNYFSIHGIAPTVATATISAEPSSMVCSGETVKFKSEVVNGGMTAYQWYKNGNTISGANGDTLSLGSLANKDTITCRVISKDPCVVDSIIYSNKIGMTVNSPPSAPDTINGPVVVNVGAVPGPAVVTYFIPEIPNAEFYIWQLSPGMTGVSMINSISVHFETMFTFGFIRVRAANSCGSGAADSIMVRNSVVELKVTEDARTTLYPNPFDETLSVTLRDRTDEKAAIEVYDATGRLLAIDRNQKMNEMTLDFKSQPSGIYLIKIAYKGTNELYKVVKR